MTPKKSTLDPSRQGRGLFAYRSFKDNTTDTKRKRFGIIIRNDEDPLEYSLRYADTLREARTLAEEKLADDTTHSICAVDIFEEVKFEHIVGAYLPVNHLTHPQK